MESDNAKQIRLWVEKVWNQSGLDSLELFHAPAFQNEGQTASIEDAKRWHQSMRTTYPDLRYEIDALIDGGEQIAFRWSATATHNGKLWGFIEPTGKTISWQGMHMVTIRDGRIVEIWAVSNTLSQLQQMGVRLQPPA